MAGHTFPPVDFDYAEVVKYFVRRYTREKEFAIADFVDAWKKTFDK